MKVLPFFNEAFGAILRARREEAGLSQSQLAQKIQSVRSYITFLEHAQRTPTVTTMVVLAEALGIDPETFLRDVLKERERLMRMKYGQASSGAS